MELEACTVVAGRRGGVPMPAIVCDPGPESRKRGSCRAGEQKNEMGWNKQDGLRMGYGCVTVGAWCPYSAATNTLLVLFSVPRSFFCTDRVSLSLSLSRFSTIDVGVVRRCGLLCQDAEVRRLAGMLSRMDEDALKQRKEYDQVSSANENESPIYLYDKTVEY